MVTFLSKHGRTPGWFAARTGDPSSTAPDLWAKRLHPMGSPGLGSGYKEPIFHDGPLSCFSLIHRDILF